MDAAARTNDPAATGPSGFANAAHVRAQIRTVLAGMKPDQGFAWRPLVRDGKTVAATEIWTVPGRPAPHPAGEEYAMGAAGLTIMLSGVAYIFLGNQHRDEGQWIREVRTPDKTSRRRTSIARTKVLA